ncbi:hypothetical protein HYV30_02705 [Candidatus Kaiserbacteria bacterium]|nr:hypothetical protein [Candidatus Kaiserbacteria bacterium]
MTREEIRAEKDRAKRNKEPLRDGEKHLAEGWSWYKFTPTKIELIYEPVLGRGKALLDLL